MEEANKFIISPRKSGRIIHFYVREEYLDRARIWLKEKIKNNLVRRNI